MNEQFFNQTIGLFQKFEEVDAIVLGESRASGKYDSTSDYDVYVYLNNDLSTEIRKSTLSQTCKYMDLDKTCWGAEWDECILIRKTHCMGRVHDLRLLRCFQFNINIWMIDR